MAVQTHFFPLYPASVMHSAMASTAADVELMARVALGEPAAQRILVGRLLRRVDRLCRVLLRNVRDAEDARQLSMLEILKAAHNFRGESTVERWGDRITVRTALRAVASERKAQRMQMEPEPTSTSRNAAESSVLAQEYLHRLSERQRTVLVLRHVLDYSIEEIATMEGISANTVKDRLLRARSTMRRMFRRDHLVVHERMEAPAFQSDDDSTEASTKRR
jgi:RNA polymerase sigma factor (sigma-70 family)